jgi:uncharacterized protein
MFPLGTVLVPGAVLPLHVFEPRYRALTRDCLDGDGEFGVVLIERGSEVGGDDVRTGVGTLARIVEATELPDGRWFLATVGVHRIRVLSWLADSPYPRAEVHPLEDAPPGIGHGEQLDGTVAALRRALALASELGETSVPATVELDRDPVVAAWQAVAAAPIGPHDRQRLLVEDDPVSRLRLLRDLLVDAAQALEARLGG